MISVVIDCEFMSTGLLEALEGRPPVEYIRDLVDVLQSFVWTGTWGTVFNRLAGRGWQCPDSRGAILAPRSP